MKLDVTRDVVSDLWPLCQSGDASPDSQALVKHFLAQDTDYASVLKEGDELRRVVPAVRLSPDAELRLLLGAQQRARLKLLIIGGSIVVGAGLLLAAFAGVLLLFARQGV
jgi:hypothetical protein